MLNGTATRKYLYDGLNIVAEEDASGDVDVFYVMGLNIDEPLARVESNGDVYYYHEDILGSVIALTDKDGAVVTQYNYSPFGVTNAISESVVQPFRFTAREYDPETGMYFYRARYYSPTFARFTSEDPIRFASGDVNWYRYVGNDPVNNVDPLGLMAPAVKKVLPPACINKADGENTEEGANIDCLSCSGLVPGLSKMISSANAKEYKACMNKWCEDHGYDGVDRIIGKGCKKTCP